jgi:predicted O-methyltransferase YrrM
MNLYLKLKTRFGHWTPRYIYNRVHLIVVEFKHPDWPWLTKDAILILNQLLNQDDIGLEFGSGRSTVWFAQKINHLTSIEHDNFWFSKIKEKLENDNLISKVEYNLVKPTQLDYLKILEKIENESMDFVLIDGLFRDRACLNSIPKLKKGGILIIDNINWFIPNKSYSPNSLKNRYESEIWSNIFEKVVKGWRRIYTTNGVTDTLILFKS